MLINIVGTLVVLGVLALAYHDAELRVAGAGSRGGTGPRGEAAPRGGAGTRGGAGSPARRAAPRRTPDRATDPSADLSLPELLARHWKEHRRGWELYDQALRPWERERRRRRSAEPHPVTRPRRIRRRDP